jgi:hypothetical protein
MNIRERALSILRKQQPDYVPWYGDLSYWIGWLEKTNKLGMKYKEEGVMQLYKELGVGFYLQGHRPWNNNFKNVNVNVRTENSGLTRITTVETPIGSIRNISEYMPISYTWGPREHFVKDVEDLKIIRYWYENTTYEPNYNYAESQKHIIEEHGLNMCYLPRSPLMQMVVELAGIEATTYAMMDDEDEFNETMALLREKADEAAQISLRSPAECLMIPENLSSEVVGKLLFEKYMRPYEEEWNKKIKEDGKYSFVHMDGTMKGLISETSLTGFSVLEALTPSPVGDIEMQDIHKYVPGDNIIWGGLPGAYFTDAISDEEFDNFVIGVLEVMKSEPTRYVLGVADQVPPYCRWERIARVSQLVEKYGRY